MEPNSQLALVGANIDATGVSWGIRNRDAQLFVGLTNVANASLINFETLAGVSQVFGPLDIGDDDDFAISAGVGVGGVIYLQKLGFFGTTPTVMTLKSSDKVMDIHSGGTIGIVEDGTALDITGGDIVVSKSGSFRLNQNANLSLSGRLKVTKTGLLEISAREGQLISINADVEISESGIAELDLEESPGGTIMHTGNIYVAVGGTLSIKGDPNDPALVSIANNNEASAPAVASRIEVTANSKLNITKSQVNGLTNVSMNSTAIIDHEASLVNGPSSLTTDTQGAVLFVDGAPSTPIDCGRDGKAWDTLTTESHCATP
jgi:hypothetical protein